MIQVFLLIVSVTLPDGTLQMSVGEAGDRCPTDQEAHAIMDPFISSGDITNWDYVCKEVYLSTKKDKES